MTDDVTYNRYSFTEITKMSYKAHEGYQETVDELVVFKSDANGALFYLVTNHCSCCGSNYEGDVLTPLELGSFILVARKWARNTASENDAAYLHLRVKSLIDQMINYVDEDQERLIEAANLEIRQARNVLAELDKVQRSFNTAMQAKLSAATARLNAAHESYNKLIDC